MINTAECSAARDMTTLRCKFGGVVLVAVCWSLLMVYLVNFLEWVPTPSVSSLAVREISSTSIPTTSQSATTTASSLVARVLIASDGMCLGGLVSAVNSVLVHTRHAVKFYLVTTAQELAHLRSWIEATKLHRMRYELHTLNALTTNTSGGLQRVKMRATELFPELRDRLVYLDCDVIVQGDIWELFNANIQPGHYGAFSHNCVDPAARLARPPRLHTYLNLAHSALNGSNLDPKGCPFATGVFVANLTLWRRHSVTERVLRWLDIHQHERIVGSHPGVDPMEAAMLIVMYGRVTTLDPAWNVQHLSRYSKQFVERAKLLHWNGRHKPWNHRVPHADVWHRYYIPDPTAQFRPARKRV